MKKYNGPLENIKVASPCSQDWNTMSGDDRRRFCGICKLNVYNLSGMSRMDAENLLVTSEGRLCVRYFRRSDGTILTRDCPVGWAAVRRRISKTASALISLMFGVIGGLGANTMFKKATTFGTMGIIAYEPTPKRSPKPTSTPGDVIMGDVAMPAPTPKNAPSPRDYFIGKVVNSKNGS